MKYVSRIFFIVIAILLFITTKSSALESEKCAQLPESGRCLAAFRNYYYDPEAKECKQFIYGGCGGNDNNFNTIEECEQACKTGGN